jgi:hypothetical protein
MKVETAKTAKSAEPTTRIENSEFYGVRWDAQAVSAIQTVADGLLANAQALGKLAEVFKSQNINIECLIKIEGNK